MLLLTDCGRGADLPAADTTASPKETTAHVHSYTEEIVTPIQLSGDTF